MAAYASQFVPYLLRAQHSRTVVESLGTDIMSTTKETYNDNLTILVLISMLMKIIQDLHPTVATDAAFLDRLNHALDTGPSGDQSGWLGWVVLQIKPEDLAIYGGLETDTIAVLQAKIDAHNAGRPGGHTIR